MFTRNKNLLGNSVPSSLQVYKPLFEAVGDGSGGKSLEDVFYEHEVRHGERRPHTRSLTLGASELCASEGPVVHVRWRLVALSRADPRARRHSGEKAALPASRGGTTPGLPTTS